MRILQVLGQEERLCPVCNTKHSIQEVVVDDRTVINGFVIQHPGRYFHCPASHEFYADLDMTRWNVAQRASAMPNIQFGFGPAASNQ